MSQPGLGVMLSALGGASEKTATAIRAGIGKRVAEAAIVNNALRLKLADGSRLRLWDGGQSCCESRYMTCDDDLPYYAGAELLQVEVKDGPTVTDDCDVHEQQFLVVTTSKGSFTVANHNEHNGYYGGISLEAQWYPAAEAEAQS